MPQDSTTDGATEPVLLDGSWVTSDAVGTFVPPYPASGRPGDHTFPVSSPAEVARAVAAGAAAARELRSTPTGVLADLLDAYADAIEGAAEELVAIAHAETALPPSPRLEGEIGRTTGQLRQAAAARRDASWRHATIDTASNIRSALAPLDKPVVVFGPNNFPFGFNGISGGDFAAAIAAGNPVIAKSNPGHPRTTQRLAELAHAAVEAVGAPSATIQLLHHMEPATGLGLVADQRLGAVAFTGSKRGGLALKAAADAAGVPIYLELGSINPTFLLPGALARPDELAEEFFASCTLGVGQFCTNPGLVVVPDGPEGDRFAAHAIELFANGDAGTLLGKPDPIVSGIETLVAAGAEVLAGGGGAGHERFTHANTLLSVDVGRFLESADELQTEVFGPVSLLVRVPGLDGMVEVARRLEGNLTGTIYSTAADDDAYEVLAAELRPKVGRLLNDQMPTGVAVVPSMNHGGPYPSTGHPGFTAVGIPASLRRFAALHCYDNVPDRRLPEILRDANTGGAWRSVDGTWTTSPIS